MREKQRVLKDQPDAAILGWQSAERLVI